MLFLVYRSWMKRWGYYMLPGINIGRGILDLPRQPMKPVAVKGADNQSLRRRATNPMHTGSENAKT